MKKMQYIVLLIIPLLCYGNSQLKDASTDYIIQTLSAESKYKAALGKLIKNSDKVKVYKLGKTSAYLSEDPFAAIQDTGFEISPHNQIAEVLNHKVLEGQELLAFQNALYNLLQPHTDVWSRAMCHEPILGVEVFIGSDLIFSTSFCWKCNNYFVEYPDGRLAWEALKDTELQELAKKLWN